MEPISIPKWPIVLVWIVSIVAALSLTPVTMLTLGASGDSLFSTIVIKLIALTPIICVVLAIVAHALYKRGKPYTTMFALSSTAIEILAVITIAYFILTMSFT